MIAGDEHRKARELWDRKPALRVVYGHLYRMIVETLTAGTILEIGAGGGQMKSFRKDAIVSDLVGNHYVDLVADAQALPFSSSTFDNIVAFDVLHHIERPRRLFAEAVRVLRPLGRLILMEPAVTAGSYFFYRFFHPEPFDMSVDPLGGVPLSSPLPYDSNQAIPTLLATCYRHELTRDFPELKLALVRWTSILAYPLSGGLRPWSMVGPSVAAVLLRFEDRVPQSIMRFLAFRILLVLQRDVNEACDPMVTVKVLGSE